MSTMGETTTAATGQVLLVAATPRARPAMTLDAALAALAAVPAAHWTATGTATQVELAHPRDPQAVLTRLRTAAATPGPLVVYLVGQLMLDRRGHRPHLALADSSPATVRYNGMPWHWIAAELAERPRTTVFADLVATDGATWRAVTEDPHALDTGTPVYGMVTPPPAKGRRPRPARYTTAAADTMRAVTAAPPLDEFHDYLVRHRLRARDELILAPSTAIPAASTPWLPPPSAPADEPAPALPQAPTAPEPAPRAHPVPASPAAADPVHQVLGLARAGRHNEALAMAATWEQHALRQFGAASVQAIVWTEARAELAELAGLPVRACELWAAAAHARLRAPQPPDSPEVEHAADQAHQAWDQVTDPARARELGPDLVALRRRVPGRRPGALEAAQARLTLLQSSSGT